MEQQKNTTRSPWLFVPTLYFMQGVPYVIIVNVSAAMYTTLGISASQMGLWTSLITWPWVLKMLWGPLVDTISTKRNWVVITQALLLAGFVLVAFGVNLPNFFIVTLAVFFVMAFLSATHDIAADGYYLLAMDKKDQAFFVGIRSTAYRLAMIFGNGALVVLAGRLAEERGFTVAQGWMTALLVGGALYGIFWLYGLWAMPRPVADVPGGGHQKGDAIPFVEAFVTYFRKPRILAILAFILLYRAGEFMIVKMTPPFLLETGPKGNLGFTTEQFGVIYGTFGILALVVGGILGGMAIARWGLRKCLWPMVLSMNLPCLGYIWAAIELPTATGLLKVAGTYAVVVIDQFGYGFGFAAYMVFLMYASQGSRYQTSHYAISTGLMALGAMGAGILSGFLLEWLGFVKFFIACCILTIPGMLTLLFIPLYDEEHNEARELSRLAREEKAARRRQ
jgi:PAT family beta-lactamase induction signal transducer AmpG